MIDAQESVLHLCFQSSFLEDFTNSSLPGLNLTQVDRCVTQRTDSLAVSVVIGQGGNGFKLKKGKFRLHVREKILQ